MCLQLSALYEGKPPVSRAKMAQLTKAAIKAIKFYKHVVQSVEKFIMKVSRNRCMYTSCHWCHVLLLGESFLYYDIFQFVANVWNKSAVENLLFGNIIFIPV